MAEILSQLIGESPAAVELRDKIRGLIDRQASARRFPPILLEGETGTGKGLVAQLLHRASPRSAGPFVDVNCAAIPETLLEAEMFGFERGAFTEARQAKPGLFQAAHGGTIFLDEIGLLPETLQGKLLKVLEDRTVRRLGSVLAHAVDVQIIAATSRDLGGAVRDRAFREDLYHRLAVLALRLPALRERGPDIVLLAEHFLARTCSDYGLPAKRFSPQAKEALLACPWPGNVRELSNVVERVALMSDGDLVTADALSLTEAERVGARPTTRTGPGPLDEALRDHLLAALAETKGNITKAAAQLGIARNTFLARMRKFGLRRDDRPVPASKARTSDVAVPFPSSPGQPVTEPTGVRWETRLLTFLRAELIGPDDEAIHAGSSRFLDVITEKIRGFGGRVEDLSPGAAVGVFGVIPGEDAPVRAALAAIAVQKAMPRTSTRGVRVALHLADLLVAESAGMFTIEMEAKRTASAALDDVLTAAEPGAVAVTSGLALSLRRRFHLAPAVTGFRLLGARAPTVGLEGRPAAFVGRDRELETLRDRFEAAARGEGQIVGILGEPGIGKSRLLHELRRSLDERGTWLEAHAAAHTQSTPYAPVLELLRTGFAIGEDDEPPRAGEAIRRGLQRIDPSLEQARPALLGLFGIANPDGALPADAKERRRRITEAVRALVVAASRKTPQVVVVEDIHWIDASSLEMLHGIAGTIARMPVLIVTTQRPGTAVPWAGKATYTQVALGGLVQPDVEALALSLLGVQQLPGELTRVLADKAEGNPLHVEEITASLLERGALVQGPDAIRWVPGVPFEIPSTLRDVMRARVDRLDAAVRHTLQTASVIGREFSRRILERVLDTPGAVLGDHLVALVAAELVHPTDHSDEEFVFKHALLHEAVYEAVPEKRCLLVHRLVGGVLEGLWQHGTDEVSAQLAHHFDRGGEPGRALHWSATAGDRARAVFANREALSAYDRALALADDPAAGATSDRRLHLYRSRGQTRSLLGDYPGAAEDFRLARTLAQALGEVIAEAIALSGSAQMAMFDGRYDIAIADAREALRLARAADDQATIARSLITLGDIHIHGIRGGDEEGVRYLDEALPLCRSLGDRQGLAETLCHLGYVHLLRGAYPTSTSLFEESAALAREIDDRQRLAFDLIFLGIVRMDLADFREAARLLRDGIETAEAIDAGGLAAVGRTFLGWVEIKRANHIEAKALLEEALATFEAAGARGWIPLVLDIQGEQLCRLGALDEARRRFDRALPLGRAVADPCWQSFALTGLAYCAGMAGGLDESRAHLEESLALCGYKSDMWVRCRAQALAVGADVLLAGRDAGAALEVTRTLLDFVGQLGMRQLEGEARLLRGRALALLGETTTAEAELKTAVELAQALDDPLLCRDAALALARICEDLGRAEAAREAEDLGRNADDRLRRQTPPVQGTGVRTPSP